MTSPIGSNVLSSVNAGGAPGMDSRQSDELRNNFMTLLITQLQNQDPLNPLENSELTSQLAQINTVSGISELNSTLEGITGQLDAGQAMQAAGLIGSGVLVPGNRVLVGEDGSTTPFGVELEQAADEVQITVRNDSGEVVRRFEPFAMDAGSESFTWNGERDSGEEAPKGSYTVSVEASADGEPLEVVNLNYAMVSGVSLDDNGAPLLDLGGVSEQVSLGDIRQIL